MRQHQTTPPNVDAKIVPYEYAVVILVVFCVRSPEKLYICMCQRIREGVLLHLDEKTLSRMRDEALKERKECAYNGASDIRDNTHLIWAPGRHSDAFRNNHACWDIIPTCKRGRKWV